MTDKFVLSVGLAHQLQHAFERAGWSVEEVNELSKGTVLSVVHEALFERSESSDIEERRKELKRLVALKLRSFEETKALIQSVGDASLEEVFNPGICAVLGYPNRIRVRVINALATWGQWSQEEGRHAHQVTTLRQLLQPREKYAARLPMGLGTQSENLIRDVLARYGFEFPAR